MHLWLLIIPLRCLHMWLLIIPSRYFVYVTVYDPIAMFAYQGFRTRMVYLDYIACLRYTIMVRNPQYVTVYNPISGWNHSVSSMLGSLSCVIQLRGVDPPLSLLVEGIFPLELTLVLIPFPRLFWMRVWTKVQSVHTCIPSHGLKRPWHLCPWRVNIGNKNILSMHDPQKWNVTTSMAGLKNGHIYKSLT